jgi:phosphoribosylaminoimidazole-succinocarboxamide synthase
MMNIPGLYESTISSLPLLARGKVRDIYEVDSQHLLMVTTDRLSAFDVVFPTPIPGKGILLNQMSLFWFHFFEGVIPNHLTTIEPETVVQTQEQDQVKGRAVVVKRLNPIPVEAVVRGYLEGSGWKDYQSTGHLCGYALPPHLKRASELPTPLFTPATKAAVGDHDENITIDTMIQTVGAKIAHQIQALSLDLYQRARSYARQKGILIADTKFEFGLNPQGEIILMDEVLTPDSSRFWAANTWTPGISPESIDKQFIRNWVEHTDWNKEPPAPEIPPDIVMETQKRYQKALQVLTGNVGVFE